MNNAKCIKIIIKGEEFVLDNIDLVDKMKQVLQRFEICENMFMLPDTIAKTNFEFFLFISNHSDNEDKCDYILSSLSLNAIKSAFIIANELKADNISNYILRGLNHMINEENAIDIFSIFFDLIREANQIISNCIQMIIPRIFDVKDKILSLPKEQFEYLFEQYASQKEFDSVVIDIIRERNQIDNNQAIFDLIEIERKRILNSFSEKSMQKQTLLEIPLTTNKINQNQEIYEEKSISISSLSLTVIAFYASSIDTLNIAFQFQDIISSSTLPSNNMLISILSQCEIEEINYKSKINFNCVYFNTQSKMLIYKISNFKSKVNNGKITNFTLKIKISRNFFFPSLLIFSAKNFNKYSKSDSIEKIPKAVFLLILKHAQLNRKNENDILSSVCQWIRGKCEEQYHKAIDLFSQIKWKNLSGEEFADFLIFNAKIISKVDNLCELLSSFIFDKLNTNDDNARQFAKLMINRIVANSDDNKRENNTTHYLVKSLHRRSKISYRNNSQNISGNTSAYNGISSMSSTQNSKIKTNENVIRKKIFQCSGTRTTTSSKKKNKSCDDNIFHVVQTQKIQKNKSCDDNENSTNGGSAINKKTKNIRVFIPFAKNDFSHREQTEMNKPPTISKYIKINKMKKKQRSKSNNS